MRSFQSKILSTFETLAQNEDSDLELVQLANYANTGVLLVQKGDQFNTLVTVKYDFQSGKSTINFNEATSTAPSPDTFYFDATDSAKISRMFARFLTLLKQAQGRRRVA